jgi:hypothetical protein
MAIPVTRDQFKQTVLRRLGAPVIEVNVDPDQLDDRIDEALKYYYDYHFDGSEKIYYKHQVTAQNIADKWIPIPENVMGVVSIFDLGSSLTTSGMFSIQYQIALNDLYTLTTQSMVPYFMTMQHLQFMQDMLVGKQPIRYNRHVNKLYVDMNWDKVVEGQYLIVECYQVVDPEEFTDVWNDRWLTRYATALVGLQWATNLTKFKNMQLPGGVQFDADGMLQRYQQEIIDLERDMVFTYSLPVNDLIG